jgi:hypothetical protein
MKASFRRKFSVRHIILLYLFTLIFFTAIFEIGGFDFWWHLKAGQYILETKTVPNQEIFSYTKAGEPWIAHEWLSEVILYSIHRSFNFPGIIIFRAFLILFIILIIFKTTLRRANLAYEQRGNIALTSGLIILAVIAFSAGWTPRPHFFSYLFFALFFEILEGYRWRERNLLFLIPFLMVLWVNLHGGFILGFLLLSFYLMGEIVNKEFRRARFLLIVLLFTILAALINPYTYKGLFYPFSYFLGANRFHKTVITEWFPPDFKSYHVQVYEIILFLGILSFILSPRRVEFLDWGLFLFFTHFSLRTLKYLPFFALAVPPLIAGHLTAFFREKLGKFSYQERPLSPRLKLYFQGGLLIFWIFLSSFLYFQRANKILSDSLSKTEKAFPKKAVDFLLAHPEEGNLFNKYRWGGYLIWREVKVFVDGRADVYGRELIGDYLQVQRGENWKELLEKYEIEIILWPQKEILPTLLKESPEWQIIYEDEIAVIFQKT